MSLTRLLSAAALLGSLAPLQAAPIDYDEAVNGDLTTKAGTVQTVLQLGSGVNRIAGRFGRYGDGSFADSFGIDFDGFSFTLLPGQLLTQLSFEVSDPEGAIANLNWNLRSGTLVQVQGDWVGQYEAPSPGSASVELALGAGDYNLYTGFSYWNTDLPRNKVGNYILRLTVRDFEPDQRVPLPGSLALAALGLLMLPAARRLLASNASA